MRILRMIKLILIKLLDIRSPSLSMIPGLKGEIIMIEWNDEIHALTKWSRITGINKEILRSRYRRGDRSDRLFRKVKR